MCEAQSPAAVSALANLTVLMDLSLDPIHSSKNQADEPNTRIRSTENKPGADQEESFPSGGGARWFTNQLHSLRPPRCVLLSHLTSVLLLLLVFLSDVIS